MLEISSWDLEFPEGSNLSLPSLPGDTDFSDGHSLYLLSLAVWKMGNIKQVCPD